jgi:hypothetical protein
MFWGFGGHTRDKIKKDSVHPYNVHLTTISLGDAIIKGMCTRDSLEQLLIKRPHFKNNYELFLDNNKSDYTDERKKQIISGHKTKHPREDPVCTIERYMQKSHRSDNYLFEKLEILGYCRELHQFMLSLFVFRKQSDLTLDPTEMLMKLTNPRTKKPFTPGVWD